MQKCFAMVLLCIFMVLTTFCLAAPLTISKSITINDSTTFSDEVTVISGAIITVNAPLYFKGPTTFPRCRIFSMGDSSVFIRFSTAGTPYIFPQWFGATGVHDEYGVENQDDFKALQSAINSASVSGIPLNLGRGIYYTSCSLDVKDTEIYGSEIAGINLPARAMFVGRDDFLRNKYGMKSYHALFQDGHGPADWQCHVSGAVITSMKDISILYSNRTPYLHDFGIVGYMGAAQTGLTIHSNSRCRLKDFSVLAVGGDGIVFTRGLQLSTLENIRCSFNKGNGMAILHDTTGDCPQEYLNFSHCTFIFNQFDGLYIDQFRKRITVRNCYFTGNGWYKILGTTPSHPSQIKAGMHLVSSPPQKNHPRENLPPHSSDVVFEENYAEELFALIKIETRNVLNGITIRNNCMMPMPIDGQTSYVALLLGEGSDKYLRSVDISQNCNYGSTNTPQKQYYSNVGNLIGIKVLDTNDPLQKGD